jgi:hypothetical protein
MTGLLKNTRLARRRRSRRRTIRRLLTATSEVVPRAGFQGARLFTGFIHVRLPYLKKGVFYTEIQNQVVSGKGSCDTNLAIPSNLANFATHLSTNLAIYLHTGTN